MSDSDLSDAPSAAVPSDTEIEKDLRDKVRRAAKAHEEYTVNSIRTASEKSFDLPQGFYKGHDTWNARSKTIIKEEADKILKNQNNSPEPESAPVKPKQPMKKKAVSKPQSKRTAPEETSRARKKTKTKSYEEEESQDSESAEELTSLPSDFSDESGEKTSKKPQKKTAIKNIKKQPAKTNAKPIPKAKPSALANSDLSDAESIASAPKDTPAQKEDNSNSDSEMSVVLDDAPSKKRSKSKDTSEQKSKAPKLKSNQPEEDPDKEEIKKLQGWLVKCGIRKVWGKELKPFETSKAKIKHLKEMLSEAGMTGRFSNEKAASIKEARELAADIEAVQEGAQRWGKSDEDDDGGNGAEDKTRSGRRIVRGAKNYAFLSSDGEETD